MLYGPHGLVAIEVKRSRHIERKDTRALREFKKGYPPARCFIFHGGSTTLHMDDVTALPIGHALRDPGQLLGSGGGVKS